MKGRSKFYGDFKLISIKQIRLALALNNYRREHHLSQKEMAHVCNLFGKQYGVTFYNTDISSYETMRKVPREKKYRILCNILNLENALEAA